MSLTQQLADMRAASVDRIPEESRKIMLANQEELARSGMVEHAPKVGEKLKNFSLGNQNGENRTLEALRKGGPVVITFYRGGWCPYCNLELRAYQQALPEITAAGATLVAITPELPDESLSTAEKNALQFEVLSDPGSDYAREINIVFTLAHELRPVYQSFGIDVEKHNGYGQFDLPLAATFVVDQEGTIAFAHVDVNYTERADPDDVVKALRSLNK